MSDLLYTNTVNELKVGDLFLIPDWAGIYQVERIHFMGGKVLLQMLCLCGPSKGRVFYPSFGRFHPVEIRENTPETV